MKKDIEVTHYCAECFSSIRYSQENAKPLLRHRLVIDVSENFSIDELTEKVKNNVNKQQCEKHPNSKVFIEISFSHRKKIWL